MLLRVVFHLLHTDRMQLYTVSEKVHQVLTVDFHSALQAAESMLVGVYHRSRHCRTHSKTKRYFSTHVTFLNSPHSFAVAALTKLRLQLAYLLPQGMYILENVDLLSIHNSLNATIHV